MHRRHAHALLILLILSLFLGSLNAVLVSRDIRFALGIFGFATSNSSNSTSSAVGQICLGAPRPVVTDVPDQSGVQDQLFEYTVNATQSGGHSINYTTNSTLFTINPDSGLISFTPLSSHVGVHTILLTAHDKQNCGSLADANDTFQLNISAGNATGTNATHPPPGGHPAPPRPRFHAQAPPERLPEPDLLVPGPYYVLEIRRIVIDGTVVFDAQAGIAAIEFAAFPNRLSTIQVTVRNTGFDQLTNIQLVPTLNALGVNPLRIAQLDPNAEAIFTMQIESGALPYDLVLTATADQDEDTEVIPVHLRPSLEKPQFGLEVPAWLPLLLAIPLLFFLGYSLTKNKQLLRDLIQNIGTALFALFSRRTYFCDEDMLRKLIKANRLNRFLHYWVVPDVYARYHDQYHNLRSRDLGKVDSAHVAVLIRQYVIGGELATLIVFTEGKPHPRIMTETKLTQKLAEDYKRIKFFDPFKQKSKSHERTHSL